MLRRLSEQDHYQVLEVSYDANSDEIQSAFETARDIYSHEALVSNSILSERERRRTFHRISEAYQTLIAEESRRLYDKRLGVPAVRPMRKFLSATGDDVEATSTPADVAPSEARVEPEHDSADDVKQEVVFPQLFRGKRGSTEPAESYSARKTSTGSTLDARHAGAHEAANATTPKSTAAAIMVTGSTGSISNKNPRRKRDRPRATTAPSATAAS